MRAVQEGTVDIGLAAGTVRTDGLQAMPYRRDRLVLATALSRPVAESKKIAFADTLENDFIGPTVEPIYRQLGANDQTAKGTQCLAALKAKLSEQFP
ncbi:LysR substrate-binding domain-containing protein [Trinickia violacea]|uniref:LysR substrate-binding domain-containing protein n=1 Tax=Trinickia violacea TaxID=2571746 RepID=UPI0020C81B02|nr:LysR substrate-binding domain-containing protein [Trinickia violacea]